MNAQKDDTERLIFALNVNSIQEALDWVRKLKSHVGYFKVGKELFVNYGPQIIKKLKRERVKIFLDLKFHDIPSVVKRACINSATMGIDMLTIHSLGGYTMMKEAVNGIQEWGEKEGKKTPIILAVTILTSISKDDLNAMGIEGDIEKAVLRLAEMAKRAGVDGVVSSPIETKLIKSKFGDDLLVVTPGIRMGSVFGEDQKRYMTPKEAIKNGADYLVLGRSILNSLDPVASIKSILN